MRGPEWGQKERETSAKALDDSHRVALKEIGSSRIFGKGLVAARFRVFAA